MTIESILNELTLEEKATLLTGAASMTTAEIERLGVPAKNMADGPHGIRSKQFGGANMTNFPSVSSLGCSWDRELAFENGKALGVDCIEHGLDMILAPGINIKRNMLCGRNFEYVGEDPILAGEMGAAYIRGVQSTGIGTSLKHFAVNSQETLRSSISAEVDERTLREIYLRGFEIAIQKSHPESVMCSYNKINGIWASENKWLLTEVLRDEWGYDGVVVSDWGAVHNQCKALMAGLDLQMPADSTVVDRIREGIEKGTVTEEQLDRAVARILRFALKPKAAPVAYDREAQHRTVQKAAAGSICLLRNEDGFLPLDSKKRKKIAVVGEFAVKPRRNGQGSAEVYTHPESVDSPLDCLRAALEGVQIDYVEGIKINEFPETHMWSPALGKSYLINTHSYDAILIFVGYPDYNDAEGYDRQMAALSPHIDYYIERTLKQNPNVCVILQTGGAVLRPRWADSVKALIQMGLAGEGGGQAIADILTGKVTPSGKLTETYPTELRTDYDRFGNDTHVGYGEGFRVGYRYYDEHPEQVWYPFGYGLSYTEFAYRDLAVEQETDGVRVRFTVENIGKREGAEVVQVYVSDPVSVVSKPKKELRNFEKVFLQAGESRSVEIFLENRDFAYYNVCLHDWVIENGRYDILVAASAEDIRLKASVSFDDDACYTLQQLFEDQLG